MYSVWVPKAYSRLEFIAALGEYNRKDKVCNSSKVTTVAFAMIITLICRERNTCRFQHRILNTDLEFKGGGPAHSSTWEKHSSKAIFNPNFECLSLMY